MKTNNLLLHRTILSHATGSTLVNPDCTVGSVSVDTARMAVSHDSKTTLRTLLPVCRLPAAEGMLLSLELQLTVAG